MRQVRTRATSSNEVSARELVHRELARRAAAESIVLLKNDEPRKNDVPLDNDEPLDNDVPLDNDEPHNNNGLRNNNGVLPLAPCPVALYGAGAATTIKGGTGSGEVNERYSVTIEQGLINAGFEVRTNAWLREYEQLMLQGKKVVYKRYAKKMLRTDPNIRINIMADSYQYPVGRQMTAADIEESACDTCIYVIARQAGECSDRTLDGLGFCLADAEIDNLRIVASAYAKVILVINVSGAIDLTPLDGIDSIDGIGAILFYCQQGMEGGNALADILTGETTPSGCLSASWPMRYQDLPNAMEYSYLKGASREEEYKEGIYVGYRFYDSFRVAPRFEFGYGLSYTEFAIRHLCTTVDGSQVEVVAEVTNVGERYSGKKCVQLYVSVPSGKLLREYQSLAAFAKTEVLVPGQSQRLALSFDITQLAGYDEKTASFLLEQGDYILRLGGSSRNTEPVAVLSLGETVVTERCTNVCRLKREIVEIEPPFDGVVGEAANGAPSGTASGAASEASSGAASGAVNTTPNTTPSTLQHLTIHASDIPTKTHNYQLPTPSLSPKTEALLRELTLKDMIRVVVATGLIDNNPHISVFGAAAHTTSHLASRGVPNAALCDGPAGLRLSRTLVKMKNGRIKPVEPDMELKGYMYPIMRDIMFGKANQGELLYQYASAFPVGTAMAQTWNTDLIEQIGRAVGTEMVEFGASFLLAPGMNIQRNPLCGRNYEYYSEDPLLTGKMAAAMTKGVQSFDGCYVTIKHFAANNQETNRNYSNSIVSERTLREIYLKGFRIAVEEGGAKAVMTSYNKLNGIYTPNSFDLCTTLLRCEWSFEGVVMTDWFAADRGLASNGLAIKAGNDLICPGGAANRKALKRDLDANLVSHEDIRTSCARILEAAINGRTGMYGE